jgi:regulator of protease activity HflC (stomatin/prohibitin superfamily)
MDQSTFNAIKYIGYTILAIVLFSIFAPFTIIGAGERAVVARWGVIDRTLDPGINFVMPLADHVEVYSVQTQKEVITASASSQDMQTVTADVALNYNVNPNAIAKTYAMVRQDYKTIIIDPALQEAIKATTAKYTATDLIGKRDMVTQEILANVKNGLAERGKGNELITPISIAVTDIKFSEQFNNAIEAKVTAQQNAETAKNKLAQVQYEADQTVTKAKADAEAIQIQAQAINSQGGADYVSLQAIAKWDGHLPTQMIPGQTVPFINITK